MAEELSVLLCLLAFRCVPGGTSSLGRCPGRVTPGKALSVWTTTSSSPAAVCRGRWPDCLVDTEMGQYLSNAVAGEVVSTHFAQL